MYKCAHCEATFLSKETINQHFWEAHQISQTNIENVFSSKDLNFPSYPLNQVHDGKMPETSPTFNQSVETMEISTNSINENEENMFHRVSSRFEFQVAHPTYPRIFLLLILRGMKN